MTIAQARVTYDQTKLSFRSISYSGSPLTTDTPDTRGGNGYYLVSRFKTGQPYPSGNFVLARITFEALEDSGSASLGIATGTSLVFDEATSSNILGSLTGVSVNLSAPASSPQPPSPGTQNPSSGSQTPPNNQDNNGQPTAVVKVSDNQAKAAADKTMDEAIEINSKKAEVVGTFTPASGNKNKFSLPLIIGMSGLAVLCIGYLIFRHVISPKRPSFASSGSAAIGSSITSSNQNVKKEPPVMNASGSVVIKPQSGNDQDTPLQ